ncbi:uncharacterized protein PITG_17421 [Phytophthora infestans T30-4]|uniref:Uncharacterized protein n=1 Tax=Phytophthora infestans (strain T30-4) TaxID=403677 RepID=D0NW14_PHYIT|nr:uncharacterized protein PITG_17421 [Phytophthora infestans T30-4]EEY66850.1 hypothetical protein PITG_17421 [Phytophthora infestans T30-4]|eukprot:XP_002896737.1 hypothetical protein PITG_17421 [Phytophthora infestans T30-4]
MVEHTKKHPCKCHFSVVTVSPLVQKVVCRPAGVLSSKETLVVVVTTLEYGVSALTFEEYAGNGVGCNEAFSVVTSLEAMETCRKRSVGCLDTLQKNLKCLEMLGFQIDVRNVASVTCTHCVHDKHDTHQQAIPITGTMHHTTNLYY